MLFEKQRGHRHDETIEAPDGPEWNLEPLQSVTFVEVIFFEFKCDFIVFYLVLE